MKEDQSGCGEKVVFPKRVDCLTEAFAPWGRDGPSASMVGNGVERSGGSVLDSRCPSSCPRKGCDVSCVNLTLIRRVINARVNIR